MTNPLDNLTVRDRMNIRYGKEQAAPSLRECPKCGAVGDNPCLTKAGKPAKNEHKERA